MNETDQQIGPSPEDERWFNEQQALDAARDAYLDERDNAGLDGDVYELPWVEGRGVF